MSVKIYPKVLDLEMRQGPKLIMAVLADHSDESGLSWPSQKLLSVRASISIRNLRNNLKKLEEEGWLRICVGEGRGGVNKYRLNLNKIFKSSRAVNDRMKLEKARHNDKAVAPDVTESSWDVEYAALDDSSTSQGLYAHSNRMQASYRNVINRQRIEKEPSDKPSVDPQRFRDTGFSPDITEDSKNSIKLRIKGWAELEQTESGFSERQMTGLQKALVECVAIAKSEMISEYSSWDFLEADRKEIWKERINSLYDVAQTDNSTA